MFSKIVIADRGEIACRVIRIVRREADENLHLRGHSRPPLDEAAK